MLQTPLLHPVLMNVGVHSLCVSAPPQDFAGAVTSSLDAGGEVVERCMYCFRDFPLSKLVVHAEKCKGDMLGETRSGRFKAFLPSVHDVRGVHVMLAS